MKIFPFLSCIVVLLFSPSTLYAAPRGKGSKVPGRVVKPAKKLPILKVPPKIQKTPEKSNEYWLDGINNILEALSPSCSRCKGKGTVICSRCDGAGKVPGVLWGQNKCSSCNGNGRRICNACDGSGKNKKRN